MLNEIDFSDGDCVVDCGANVGDLLLFFEFSNISIDYIGIEPSPKECLCLKKNAKKIIRSSIQVYGMRKVKRFFTSAPMEQILL